MEFENRKDYEQIITQQIVINDQKYKIKELEKQVKELKQQNHMLKICENKCKQMFEQKFMLLQQIDDQFFQLQETNEQNKNLEDKNTFLQFELVKLENKLKYLTLEMKRQQNSLLENEDFQGKHFLFTKHMIQNEVKDISEFNIKNDDSSFQIIGMEKRLQIKFDQNQRLKKVISQNPEYQVSGFYVKKSKTSIFGDIMK